MKNIITMLALLALTGNAANAQLLKNFKYNGSLETQGFVVNNAKDFNSKAADKFGEFNNRLMVNAGFDLNADVDAVLTLAKCNRQVGDVPEAPSAIADSSIMEQAYLNLKGVFGLDHKIGRQYYGNDGDIIVYYGPANWYTRGLNANSVAFDGWTTGWQRGKLALTAMMGKDLEDAAGGLGATGSTNIDKDVYGVTATYDLNEKVKPGVYYYQKNDMSTLGSPNVLKVFGAKAAGKFAGVGYNAEIAMNGGSDKSVAGNRDYKGSAVKLNAMYDLDFKGKLALTGEFVSGTGDTVATNKNNGNFAAIRANYRPGLIAGGIGATGGLVTINSAANLTAWNVGANWMPSKVQKLDLTAKFYHFAYTKAAGGNTGIGNEFDVTAGWTHSENVGLKASLAAFMPHDDFLVTAGKDDMVKMAGLNLNVKF